MKNKCRLSTVAKVVFASVFFLSMMFVSSNVYATAPQITLTASPDVVDFGQTTTLEWNIVDADACQRRKNEGNWNDFFNFSGAHTTSGLLETTTFELKCQNVDGETQNQVTVTVISPPTLSFEAESYMVDYNTSTNLIWYSENATSCTASGFWGGDVGVSGQYNTGNLISAKTYILTCEGVGGSIEKFVHVEVGSPVDSPTLNFFADNYILEYNTSTNLQWTSSETNTCTASGDWNGTKDLDGNEDTGNLIESQQFILECVGDGGSVASLVNIFVESEPTFPVELIFTVDDEFVDYEGSTTLHWETEHADSGCTAEMDWTGNKGTNGSFDTGTLLRGKSYRLRCVGSGGLVIQTIDVEVGANPYPPPTLDFYTDDSSIPFNTSTTLHWSSENADEGLSAELDWSESISTDGSYDTGNLTEDQYNYKIRARGRGGELRETVSVYVDDPLDPPTVEFWADDNNIPYNSGTTLHWTSSFADWCKLEYPSGTIWGDSGNYPTDNLLDNTIYTLTCGNEAGAETQGIMINVGMVGDPPDITLWADDYEVYHNSSTTLRWVTVDADSCRWEDIGSTSVAGSRSSGTIYEIPKTFTIECIGSGGISSESITIDILPSSLPDELPTLEMWADQYSFYGSGQTTIHWEAAEENKPERCWAWGDHWSGDKSFSGSFDTGEFHEERTYGMTCENLVGQVSTSVTLSIIEMDDIVLDFWADEIVVDAGGFTNLNWHARNAVACIASGDWSSSKTVEEESFETMGPLNKYISTYILACQNWTSSVTKTITVLAGSPPPDILLDGINLVPYNSQAFLWWESENADRCVLSSNNDNEHSWVGTRAPSGFENTSNLKKTTKFSVECFGPGGNRKEDKTVVVGASGVGAPNVTLWADDYIVAHGEEVDIHWESEDADRCYSYSSEEDLWSGEVTTSGNQTLTIDSGGYLMFSCYNGNGYSNAKITIRTGQESVEPPSVSLWLDEMIIPVGTATTLHWSAENVSLGHCTAIGDWSGSKMSGGGSESTGIVNSKMNYGLSCSNASGTTVVWTFVDVGGVIPEMTLEFLASDYDLSAGDSAVLTWNTEYATSCYVSGVQTDDWRGPKHQSGADLVSPNVTTTYSLTCENPRGWITQNLEIKVAKVLICPANPLITKGTDLNLIAWYKQDSDESFVCDGDLSGAVDVTSGYDETMIPSENMSRTFAKLLGINSVFADFFNTIWSSDNNASVTSNGNGVVSGVEYTSVAGPATVFANFKETVGSTTVTVTTLPVTCWTCVENKNCVDGTQYPPAGSEGQCSVGTYKDEQACQRACKKPTKWIEIGS